MQELTAHNLETVAGGIKKSELQNTLTQVQSSISSLANTNSNSGSNTTTMMMLALAMQNRQTVVAAPAAGCTVVQPTVSFRARFRF